MQPLTDETILAAVRENARIANVQSGPTVPDAEAVMTYHRVRSILIGVAMRGAERFLAHESSQPFGATADDIATVERHREEIIRADPQIARMLSAIDARRSSSASTAQAPRRSARGRATHTDRPTEAREPPATVRPAIGYLTPKGKPQVFRQKSIGQVWKRLERFFRACTDADPLRPASAMLMFAETSETMERLEVAAALERARAALGPSRAAAWAGLGVLHPEVAASSGNALVGGGVQHRWNVRPDQIEVALELLLAGDPWPRMLIPIASLAMLHQFHWTGTGRDGNGTEASICNTHLSARSSLMPSFLFPFEAADESFLAYLDRIKTLVPIPLSAKNFRVFQPTRTGTFVPRVFDTSAIANVLER